MLNGISSRELSEWMAYDRIEPFGETRADLRIATIVRAVISPWVKKGHKPPTLKECMLDFEVKEPMETGEIKGFLRNLTASRGGKINDGND